MHGFFIQEKEIVKVLFSINQSDEFYGFRTESPKFLRLHFVHKEHIIAHCGHR